MVFDDLSDDNFITYAMRNYDTGHPTSLKEFYQDLLRIKYLKRLLKHYNEKGSLKPRLILNHIIVLYNVFGAEAATRILFQKSEEELLPVLVPFIAYLGFLPPIVDSVNGKKIDTSKIDLNIDVVNELKEYV